MERRVPEMTDEEIVSLLRAEGSRRTAVELAELLNDGTSGALSQGAIVTFFKRAFPSVPLKVLLDAGAWSRVGSGELTDGGFNELLPAVAWEIGAMNGSSGRAFLLTVATLQKW
jgi:hypothetical protein